MPLTRKGQTTKDSKMKKALTKIEKGFYHWNNGKRVKGIHKGIIGDVTGISGDVTRITGDVSEIYGNVTEIFGDVTDISGDFNDCNITDEDRQKGINITDLII